jgi:hypothetical protein
MIHEPLVAYRVLLAFSVLAAIKLDDETAFTANKIDEIRPDWFLANEFASVDGA